VGDGRGKKEVAASVLIKTIKYYENTKYALNRKVNSSRKCRIFSPRN
jgi:hypothetical protein